MNKKIIQLCSYLIILLILLISVKLFGFRIMGIYTGADTYIESTPCTPDLDDHSRHTYPYVHWCSEKSIPYRINEDGAGDGLSWQQTRTDIDSALDAWEDADDSYINFTGGTTTTAYNDNNDDKNVFFWAEEGSDPWEEWDEIEFANALTIVTIDSDIRLTDADVFFNGEKTWTVTRESGKKDVSGWALHEVGHFLGLHHVTTGLYVMNQAYDGSRTTLGSDDEDGIEWMYHSTFNASIEGPSSLEEDTYGDFTAEPDDSLPHLEYKWWYRQDDVGPKGGKGPPVGQWIQESAWDDCPHISAKGNEPSFQLAVVVTDANGDEDSTSKTITITSKGGDASEDLLKLSIVEQSLVYQLTQNNPNPFNPSTSIGYSLVVKSDVVLSIYNILGKKIRTLVNEEKTMGEHSSIWDGKDDYGRPVSAGVYIYTMLANPISNEERKPFRASGKMMLTK